MMVSALGGLGDQTRAKQRSHRLYRGDVFLFEFEGRRPNVRPEAFVAATATLIGDVTVKKGASSSGSR
jgi:hypothetical protein